MLTVSFVNLSGPGVDVANYNVRIHVNGRDIHPDVRVRGHRRSDGWLALVRLLIEQFEAEGTAEA